MTARLPSLNALRAFEAAQRHMSFQRAADELFVTPAALSYQIRQLEEQLATRLFNRLNRAVELTPDGELLAAGVEDGFAILRRTINHLHRRKQTNVLVISAGPAFTTKWLTPRIYRFLAINPDIDLRISASLNKVDLVSGDVDIALRFGTGTYPGCTSIKLMDEYMTPMCAPRLLEGDNPLKRPEDLANHTLIHDDTHIGIFELPDWQVWLEKAGVTDKVNAEGGLHFDIADNSIDAAISGAGVVFGRTILSGGDLEAGRLVAPFDLRLKADFSFYLVVARGRQNEPSISKFINWINDEVTGRCQIDTPGPAI